MEFCEKDLVRICKRTQQSVSKALKSTPFELKKVKGSTKAVKHLSNEE